MTSMCLGSDGVGADVMSLIDNFADGLPLLVERVETARQALEAMKLAQSDFATNSANRQQRLQRQRATQGVRQSFCPCPRNGRRRTVCS